MSDVIDHEDTYEAAMERRLSRGMRGKWTPPGFPYPSSHLIVLVEHRGMQWPKARCGRYLDVPDGDFGAVTDEPPATGKTCETCLRLSRRDG